MFHEQEIQRINEQERESQKQYQHRIFVCMGASCLAARSAEVKQWLEVEARQKGLEKTCAISGGGCRGLCVEGPTVTIEPDNVLYGQVKATDTADIINSLGKEPVKRLHRPTDKPFFTRQQRIVLEMAGRLNPERIEEYIVSGGYSSLLKAVTEMTPDDVINEVTRSGLRGRGGAGYPTGLKWKTVAKAQSDHKYVICNGDEGDPGAFMDRSIMDDYPHRLIEGIIIGAYAVGADRGYIYVRAEYPLSVKRLQMAIRQANRQDF